MNEWISVEDKLPEVPERCSLDLIICYNNHVVQGCYTGTHEWFQFAGFTHYTPRIYMALGDQIGSQNVYHIPNHLVTHWMPMPKAPE